MSFSVSHRSHLLHLVHIRTPAQSNLYYDSVQDGRHPHLIPAYWFSGCSASTVYSYRLNILIDEAQFTVDDCVSQSPARRRHSASKQGRRLVERSGTFVS